MRVASRCIPLRGHRLRLLRSTHDVRSHWRQGVDLHGEVSTDTDERRKRGRNASRVQVLVADSVEAVAMVDAAETAVIVVDVARASRSRNLPPHQSKTPQWLLTKRRLAAA